MYLELGFVGLRFIPFTYIVTIIMPILDTVCLVACHSIDGLQSNHPHKVMMVPVRWWGLYSRSLIHDFAQFLVTFRQCELEVNVRCLIGSLLIKSDPTFWVRLVDFAEHNTR